MSRSVEEWLNSSRRSNIRISAEYTHGDKTSNITYVAKNLIFTRRQNFFKFSLVLCVMISLIVDRDVELF